MKTVDEFMSQVADQEMQPCVIPLPVSNSALRNLGPACSGSADLGT